MHIIAIAILCIAGTAEAAASPALKAQRQEARQALQTAKRRLKAAGVERHKELLLIRERERSDVRLAKASAARGEALHLRLLDIHEKSRRDRLALRSGGREERERLLRRVKAERERLLSLRQKK